MKTCKVEKMRTVMPDRQKPPVPPSRQGKRAVTIWLEPEVVRQLNIVAAETCRTREDLMRDWLNWLFKENGKPQIA
jgi:hypothetical protein